MKIRPCASALAGNLIPLTSLVRTPNNIDFGRCGLAPLGGSTSEVDRINTDFSGELKEDGIVLSQKTT